MFAILLRLLLGEWKKVRITLSVPTQSFSSKIFPPELDLDYGDSIPNSMDEYCGEIQKDMSRCSPMQEVAQYVDQFVEVHRSPTNSGPTHEKALLIATPAKSPYSHTDTLGTIGSLAIDTGEVREDERAWLAEVLFCEDFLKQKPTYP